MAHPEGHDHADHPGDHAGLADLLDLDADVLGGYLDVVIGWVGELLTVAPRTVVDLGAGTGGGSVALARRFAAAEVVAVDRSEPMLDRLRASAREAGVDDRVRGVRADLDDGWPVIGPVDLAWASSSLHELADPDRVLRDVHSALTPGGVLAVLELDALPRFLPDAVGAVRPGLEARCREALTDWNAHPDWAPHLERAGFEVAAQRAAEVAVSAASPAAQRYARSHLGRVREAVEGRLDREDLDALDDLLTDEGPDAVLRGAGLTVRSARTAWLCRRP